MIWAIKNKSITSTFVDAGAAAFFLPHLNEEKGEEEKMSKRLKYTIDGKTRVSVVRIFKYCEDFKHVKKFHAIFFTKIFRKTVLQQSYIFVRVLRTCGPKIVVNLQCEIFVTLVRMSYDSRATILRMRISRDYLARK